MTEPRQTTSFGLLIALSLITHLALLYWMAPGLLRPAKVPAPIPVTLLPAEKAQPREIEPVPPPLEEAPLKEPAKRLGPTNQTVKQETAPKAEGVIDQVTPPSPKTTSQQKPTSQTVKSEAPSIPQEKSPETLARTAPSTPPTPVQPRSLKDLTRLPESTTGRLEKKKRDLAEGSQLQLSTREDVLNSFFLRFKRHVMGAWNYPQISRQRLEQGEVLTRLTVSRKGDLLDMEMIDGSGYGSLDDAAFEAVKRSSPFGPYSSYFEDDTLTFDVLFVYRIRGLGRELHRR